MRQNSKKSKLTLVGSGPGDPELITIKGWKALLRGKVILYDALANKALLKQLPTTPLCIDVGKLCGKHKMPQKEINQLIVDCAFQYGHVIRLKGGDPFVFGRGHEEIEHAQKFGIETEVIPGISSAIAAPASCGIPVTKRGFSESFWVITATTRHQKLSCDVNLAAQSSATLIILMGTRKLKEIVSVVRLHRKNTTPVALIQNGTLPNKKSISGDLDNIVQLAQKSNFASPGVIVIGEVARLNRSQAESKEPQMKNVMTMENLIF